jgi:peptidoglycan/xylan/chitin deacetylase (PgdA/CDA1 family)
MHTIRLPYHDRYAYSPITERKDYSWPGGKRLAVYLGLNIEHFAYGAGDGHLLTVANPPPDPRTFAWRDYGNRVGVWRCLELFDELNLPAAHLINTTVFDYAPQIVAALKARGDEFIGHGRTNAERHGGMWEADEKRFLEEVRDAIEKASGKRPRGWMAPWMASTRWTPDLLKEVGFDFLMDWPADDQPLWMKTRSGPLMSVPYPIEINDSPQILVRHHGADDFRDMIIGQFEELLRQSARQPLVCGIALHTMIVGQPYRLRALREALQHIASHPQKDKVWFTRPSDIYDHCASLPKGTMVAPPA